MSVVAAIGTILPTISRVLERVIPDPEQKAKAQVELLRLQQEGAFRELEAELQIALAQAEINKVEAASQSRFQAGWRPGAGWVCVAGLAYEFLARPILPWILTVSGATGVPELPSLDGVLFELIFGMLGLGAMRTTERWKRASAIQQIAKPPG